MNKFMGLLMIGVSLWLVQCGGGGDCEPHDGKYCDEGATYWVDSCGNYEDVFKQCECGCAADHTGCKSCGCMGNCAGKCCGDDGCGVQCPDGCASTGQTCNFSSCLCEGTCQAKTCQQLFKECGWWDDGCGTQIPCGNCSGGQTCDASGHCVGGSTCPGGLTLCGEECVNVSADPRHCGGCNSACGAGEVCENSGCITWSDCRQNPCPGFSYCDLNTGECKPGCAGDTQCPDYEFCDIATHNCACVQNYIRCDGVCLTDVHLCGGECVSDFSVDTCGDRCTPCPADPQGTPICDGVNCGIDCGLGYHMCGGLCVDNSSPQHCGMSCTPCPTDSLGVATCNGSSCGIQCNQGAKMCGGSCADILGDRYNCGDCNVVCESQDWNGTPFCNNGVCDVDCPGEETYCDGYCTDTQDDIYNCGSCGNDCTYLRAPECRDGECTCDYWCGDHTFTVCCHGNECCPDGYCTTYGCL